MPCGSTHWNRFTPVGVLSLLVRVCEWKTGVRRAPLAVCVLSRWPNLLPETHSSVQLPITSEVCSLHCELNGRDLISAYAWVLQFKSPLMEISRGGTFSKASQDVQRARDRWTRNFCDESHLPNTAPNPPTNPKTCKCCNVCLISFRNEKGLGGN